MLPSGYVQYLPLPFELLHIRSTLYHHHYSLYVLPIILTETKPTAKPSTSARRSRLRYHLATTTTTTTTKRQMRYIGKNPICLKPTFQQRSKPRFWSTCVWTTCKKSSTFPVWRSAVNIVFLYACIWWFVNAETHACIHTYKRRRQQQ
jgi:hypothetical protein